MMFILFCAGFISLSNILFFQGNKYRNASKGKKAMSYLISGSAVCDEWEWVACENGWCNSTNMKDKFKLNTIKFVTVQGINTTLVKRRACDGAIYSVGMTNYAAVLFLIFASLVFFFYMGKRTTMLDEDNVTASDYSIVVKKWVFISP